MSFKKFAPALALGKTTGGTTDWIEAPNGMHKNAHFLLEVTAGTPDFTFAIETVGADGTPRTLHSQAITGATVMPLVVRIPDPAFPRYRANVTSYVSGTYDVLPFLS
jgi:hypothetical protein